MADNAMMYAAVYSDVNAALADLDAFEEMHHDQMIGNYDAAVIDKEDGKPHIVKRTDRPTINVIKEMFGGGPLPRSELHEAAEQLDANEAELVVVGEPTLEKAWNQAVTRASNTLKRDLNESTDALADDMKMS